MKILFVVPYPSLGPSNRFRVEQYLPYIKKNGHEYSLRPFYNDKLYNILYENGFYFRKIFYLFLFSFKRLIDVFNARNYDIIFIHREAFPLGGIIFEFFFKTLDKKIIYDFDDSIFLPNVSSSNKFVNLFKKHLKIKKIIKMSDCVIAGNNYLKNYALSYKSNVFVLPTPIDTDKYFVPTDRSLGKNIIIGWIGSSTTLKYLKILNNVVREISRRYKDVLFVAIGTGFNNWESSNIIEFKEWSLESEVKDLQNFDIGIMPLTDDEWSRGKCAFKAIQYMSVGIPVIASSVGINKEVIQDGLNGFLVNNESEWIDKLALLIESPELRYKVGLAGRKIVEEKYSLKVNAPKFLEVLNSVDKARYGSK